MREQERERKRERERERLYRQWKNEKEADARRME